MGVTLTIAIWGAVTGTIAALAQFLSFWLDRPNLSVERTLTYGHDDVPGRIGIEVTNTGRRPTSIAEVGLFIDAPLDLINLVSEDYMEGHYPVVPFEGAPGEAPRIIRENDRAHVEVQFSNIPDNVHVAFLLRPYAVDINDRVWWGNRAEPLFSELRHYGWPPEPRELAVRPLPFPVPSPRAVRPRWNVLRRDPFRQGIKQSRFWSAIGAIHPVTAPAEAPEP